MPILFKTGIISQRNNGGRKYFQRITFQNPIFIVVKNRVGVAASVNIIDRKSPIIFPPFFFFQGGKNIPRKV
jgi:hypothetical protein